jgi:cell division transport system permease protein
MNNYLLNLIEAMKVAINRLRFNLSSSFMMFIVIGITMCLPSSGLLLIENLKQLSSKIEYQAEISVFMKQGVDSKKIEDFLNEQPNIKNIQYIEKEISWKNLQKKLNIEEVNIVKENPLPDSFYLTLNTLEQKDIDFLVEELKQFKEIEDINIDSAWVKKLSSILKLSKLVIFTLATLLLIVLIVIIGNTIRLQTLAYKDEIEVSKLIGASNFFIRRPFLFTGILYGLGGGIFASLLIKSIVYTFNHSTSDIQEIIGFSIQLVDLNLNTHLMIVCIAILIGWLASFLSATRSIYKIDHA